MQNLNSRILQVWNNARQSGNLLHSDTLLSRLTHQSNGLQFEVRLITSLQTKPVGSSAKRNPFLPPEPELLVDQNWTDTHSLVLNKFSVIPGHLLIITREFEAQEIPWSRADMDAIWKLLNRRHSYHNAEDKCRFLGFFNCGQNSGASQPHKHIQFIPIEDLNCVPLHHCIPPFSASQSGGTVEQIPVYQSILHGLIRLEPDSGAEDWLAAYQLLLNHINANHASTQLSYNILITAEWIFAVARSQEALTVAPNERISVNALGFAGNLLLKRPEQLQALQMLSADELMRSLLSTGVPYSKVK